MNRSVRGAALTAAVLLAGCARPLGDRYTDIYRTLHPSVALLTMQIPADDPKRKGEWDDAYGSGVVVALPVAKPLLEPIGEQALPALVGVVHSRLHFLVRFALSTSCTRTGDSGSRTASRRYAVSSRSRSATGVAGTAPIVAVG